MSKSTVELELEREWKRKKREDIVEREKEVVREKPECLLKNYGSEDKEF